jgi:hypothetical protein
MCLNATKQRVAGDPAPTATRAWKVVFRNREARHRTYELLYTDDSVHTAELDKILANRGVPGCPRPCNTCDNSSEYHYGLHVYTTQTAARSRRDYGSCIVIEVEVAPEDWVASNDAEGEAVYTKLRVIGEVAP